MQKMEEERLTPVLLECGRARYEWVSHLKESLDRFVGGHGDTIVEGAGCEGADGVLKYVMGG